MAVALFILFIVVPIAELAVIIAVGDAIGVLPTILLLIGSGILGAALAKREGVSVWRRFKDALSRGKVPSDEIVDGFLVLLGAALLLTPGFITDALGLVLLFPPTRKGFKRVAVRAGKGIFFMRFPAASTVLSKGSPRADVKVTKVSRTPGPGVDPEPRPEDRPASSSQPGTRGDVEPGAST